ncbi:MAG: hypothetical protein LBN08_05410 [Lactobacillales bacterium]|jgi:energy-coupling factor transport system substrate-specific component|nr:hypothetical protein [Lactobacillales bacterium]
MKKLTTRELVTFAILACIMFVSKQALAALPNIHLLALLITAYTIKYRAKALIPLYIYVLLEGIFAGFAYWWVPYLYIWTVLWAIVMLASSLKIPKAWQVPTYMIICGLHGLFFGMLYAPAQALIFGLNFPEMVAWIVAGFPFDVIHGIGDFAAGSLVIPLVNVLNRAD